MKSPAMMRAYDNGKIPVSVRLAANIMSQKNGCEIEVKVKQVPGEDEGEDKVRYSFWGQKAEETS